MTCADKNQGALGSEDALGLGLSMEDWGCRGILFVESFMLYKLICYGTSVKEPWQDEQKNGAQKG